MFFTLLIVSVFVWLIYDYFYRIGKPPGPIRLPIIGNLIQLMKWTKEEPHNYLMLQNLGKKYGSVASVRFGLVEQVIINDPETIREVLNSDIFSNRPISEYILMRSFGKPLGIIFSRDDRNKEIRRFCLRNLRDFGFGKKNSQEAIMAEELAELFQRFDKQLTTEGNIVCMKNFFCVSVLNIIWSMMAGHRFGHDDPFLKKLVYMSNQISRLLSPTGNVMMALPFLRRIIPIVTGYGKIREIALKEINGFFWGILEDRRKTGSFKDDQNDFIDVYINEIEKHKNGKEDFMKVYNDQQFVTTILDLFTAGFETTANSLEFGMLYMLLNPVVQAKVQEEIDAVLGSDNFPAMEYKQQMPYTEATVLEILRMSSVVSVVVRAPTSNTEIKGYKISQDTFTILNTYNVHHDPNLWENPEQFNPDRFLKDGKVVNSDKLLPFGAGKRYCLGEVLARATLFTFFVAFLQKYKISMAPGYPQPSIHGITGITLTPETYWALIHHRK